MPSFQMHQGVEQSAEKLAALDAHDLKASALKFQALFISDIHLQPESPHTAAAFLAFLDQVGTQTSQLYLLGDVFEYWAGDDDCNAPFNARIIAALRAISDAGVAMFWMAGNRDFLAGSALMQAIGATALEDPCVVVIGGMPIVLTHGDLACTDDIEYQAFRTMVRTPAWQQGFLAMPLSQRLKTIADIRAQSQAAQKGKSQQIMDVNEQSIDAMFVDAGVSLMIHGHTHRPDTHETLARGTSVVRHVLTDWDFENGSCRGGGIAIDAGGVILPLEAAKPVKNKYENI